MITIIAGFTVRRQDKAKLVEAARELIALSRKEPGNVSYALYEQTDDPYRMSFMRRLPWTAVRPSVTWSR